MGLVVFFYGVYIGIPTYQHPKPGHPDQGFLLIAPEKR